MTREMEHFPPRLYPFRCRYLLFFQGLFVHLGGMPRITGFRQRLRTERRWSVDEHGVAVVIEQHGSANILPSGLIH